ncbi:MAG: hypothetical protein DHS20C15_03210 [Planctomycetota bacterium]|nr:MAG: hypothetical protein DHS20C15_03210 [Planctomycetota bacterium]
MALADEISRRDFVVTAPQLIVLAVSAAVAIACVLFHYEAMNWSSLVALRLPLPRRLRIVVLLVVMMMAHVVEVWFFGLTFWWLDRWPELGHLPGTFHEGALDFVYYSVTCFTTLGFGDIVPTGAVRILTGCEALVGLSLITWSASFGFLEMQRDWGEFRRPGSLRDRSESAPADEPPAPD